MKARSLPNCSLGFQCAINTFAAYQGIPDRHSRIADGRVTPFCNQNKIANTLLYHFVVLL